MIYLSGCIREDILAPNVGVLLTYGISAQQRGMHRLEPILARSVWAIDNGCFVRPNLILADYAQWIQSLPHLANCLFAAAPDVVGDAAETLRRSLPALPALRSLLPVAFVAQDGIERIEIPWTEFDWLFVGGSTEFKLSEQLIAVCREAKQQGKKIHVGRVNTQRRLRFASLVGADSVDGTMIAFGPDVNSKKLNRWMARENAQPVLGGFNATHYHGF